MSLLVFFILYCKTFKKYDVEACSYLLHGLDAILILKLHKNLGFA